MKIEFEKWIESKINSKEITEDSGDLFKEAISCYKFSAYRSAFIMSYIAFQQILKKRILTSTNHSSKINESLWNNICKYLKDEDEWDKKVADCVKQNNPDRVFTISPSVVTEYDAYRVIRNRCAHGKSGKVSYCNVECFWNFIQDNFYKFVINGGKDGIIELIETHYDRTLTTPGKDPTYIADSISQYLSEDDIRDVIEKFYNYCKDKNDFLMMFSDYSIAVDLWDKLVNESGERIQDIIIDFIKDKDQLCEFAERYPSTVSKFLSDPKFVRPFWTDRIKKYKSDREGVMLFIEKLIDRNKIASADMPVFSKNVYECLGFDFPEDKVELLKKTDYFELLKDRLLGLSHFDYPDGINFANRNVKYIIRYIKYFDMDLKAVKCINKVFSFASFGEFYDKIKDLMEQSEFYEKYKAIVDENGKTDYFAPEDESDDDNDGSSDSE